MQIYNFDYFIYLKFLNIFIVNSIKLQSLICHFFVITNLKDL